MNEKENPSKLSDEAIAKILAERDEARAEKRQLDEKLRQFHIYVLTLMDNPQKESLIRKEALERVAFWKERETCSYKYIRKWKALLNKPVAKMRTILVDEHPWGIALRQNTPFGVFYKEWEREYVAR